MTFEGQCFSLIAQELIWKAQSHEVPKLVPFDISGTFPGKTCVLEPKWNAQRIINHGSLTFQGP